MATIAKNHIPKLRDVLLTEGFELDALAGLFFRPAGIFRGRHLSPGGRAVAGLLIT